MRASGLAVEKRRYAPCEANSVHVAIQLSFGELAGWLCALCLGKLVRDNGATLVRSAGSEMVHLANTPLLLMITLRRCRTDQQVGHQSEHKTCHTRQ